MRRLTNLRTVLLANKQMIFISVIVLLLFIIFFRRQPSNNLVIEHSVANQANTTLFPVQCIDTMKVSRDRAREKTSLDGKKELIAKQINEIGSLGANCVALGTPYDEEFLPYLRLWVTEARREHLHVWFRGNFSGWEGWFDYPKSMSTKDHIAKTRQFILSNSDLFEDGDIFTSSPEAENGAPFSPVDSAEKAAALRAFLVAEQTSDNQAFRQIHKSVTTNFDSMSGGVAKEVLDKKTIAQLGNVVTLDHYVKDPSDFDTYITYFANHYGANIVFGEFGGPIPDLNGRMTEDEQKKFVDTLLEHIYAHYDSIKGVNYWTLSESSSSLVKDDITEKSVVDALKTYYKPAIVKGKVTDIAGKPLSGMFLSTSDGIQHTVTKKDGTFRLVLPAKPVTLSVKETQDFTSQTLSLFPSENEQIEIAIALSSQKLPILYRLKKTFLPFLTQ